MADRSGSVDEGRFRIDSAVEIAYILRALMKSGALVTAYFNGEREFLVTAVLAVEPTRGFVILDSAANRELNDRLLQSGEVSFVSSQDGVHVRFSTSKVEGLSFEGRLAFRVPFPDSILKLQRREYFRLATPVLNPLRCEIPAADGNRVALAIADISVGGVCLVGEAPGVPLEIGTTLDGCRIALGDGQSIQTNLCIRNRHEVRLKNGSSAQHTGCEFIRLGAQQEAMVQRYIIRLERERKLRAAGR